MGEAVAACPCGDWVEYVNLSATFSSSLDMLAAVRRFIVLFEYAVDDLTGWYV